MRYQQIHSQIWRDEKFKALSEDGQRLFFYLMTCPHGNILGIFICPDEFIIEDLKWTSQRGKRRFSQAKRELLTSQLVHNDVRFFTWCIKNHFRYNPLRNQNAITSCIKMIQRLPLQSDIFQHLNLEPLNQGQRQELQQHLPCRKVSRKAIQEAVSSKQEAVNSKESETAPPAQPPDDSQKSEITDELKQTITDKILTLKKIEKWQNEKWDRFIQQLRNKKLEPEQIVYVLEQLIQYQDTIRDLQAYTRTVSKDKIEKDIIAQRLREHEADKKDMTSAEDVFNSMLKYQED